MSLDLTQFHDAFFEESFEALDSMEAALLKLDIGAPDPELVNTIFRVAHSIKGGSATFGFSHIASFTHSLETLLDALRANRMTGTTAISDLLLKSVDVMRDMLRAVQAGKPIDAQRVADLQFDLERDGAHIVRHPREALLQAIGLRQRAVLRQPDLRLAAGGPAGRRGLAARACLGEAGCWSSLCHRAKSSDAIVALHWAIGGA